jgi:AraC-like DNA-binding protein
MISYNNISPSDMLHGVKPLSSPIIIKSLYSAHNYKWENGFYFSGESHKYHEVVFILEGEVTCSEDDSIYHLASGDLIVHAPYEFHRISTDKSAHVFVFSFETDGIFPKNLYDGFFRLSIEEQLAYCRLFDKIYTFYHGENSADENLSLEISALIPAFLLNLSSSGRTLQSTPNTKSEGEYKRLVEAMKESVRENLSLEDIAQRKHTSVSYIKYLFHRYAGVGAKQYYATLRLNEAIKLLEDGEAVAEVASKLNFSSPEYFSLFFKKQTGLPPGRWRSELKK